MPVCGDSSIVPDSTLSSSPTVVSPVKRALRTYGRPRHVGESEGGTTSHTLLATSSGSRGGVYRTGLPYLGEEIPPSSDPACSSDGASDNDNDKNTSHDASPKFQFDWKKKLKELDEQETFDSGVESTLEDAHTFQSRADSLTSPERKNDKPSNIYTPSTKYPLSKKASEESSNTHASSPLSSQQQSPSPICPTHVRARNRGKRIIQDSDSDSECDGIKTSSPSLGSPAFALTTPGVHSSSTPPTSANGVSTESSCTDNSKGKKNVETVARPHLVPLHFSPESTPAGPRNNLAEGNQRKKSKIKAPTKKDLVETARDRGRIAADQQISIPRAEGVIAKYTIQTLLARLQPNSKSPQPEIPDPDPIKDFSSDHVPSSRKQFLESESTAPYEDTSLSPKQPCEVNHSQLAASIRDIHDLDDVHIPEVISLAAQEACNHKDNQRTLLETKKLILAAQNSNSYTHNNDDDSDDDLEIIQSRDMQTAVKVEDIERKSGRKKRMSEGRKRQLNLGGISLSLQREKESLLEKGLTRVAESQRGGKDNGPMTQDELNKVLMKRVEIESLEVTRKKQEEWVQRGGKLAHRIGGSLSTGHETQEVYAEIISKLASQEEVNIEVGGSDDESWAPEDGRSESGSPNASPEPDESESQTLEEEADITMVDDDNTITWPDDDEKPSITVRARRSKAKHIVDSDSENDGDSISPMETCLLSSHSRNGETSLLSPMVTCRRSLSSLDEPTEDEGDKENETSRMWDQGEDKENKAVVRHAIADGKSSIEPRKSSLLDLESQVSRSLSMSPTLRTQEADLDEENGREMSKNLMKDQSDDDLFISQASSSKHSPCFATKLQRVTLTATSPLTPFATAPFPNIRTRTHSDDASMGVFGVTSLEPGFSDLFESGTEKHKQAPSEQSHHPLNLSASISPKLVNHRTAGFADDLGLTQDITLQPAFQVEGNLLRKADQIFEKEQDFLLEAATKRPKNELELYVNDHGFLTQTRPDVPSPEIYRPALQDLASDKLCEPQPSQRRPLRTISLSESADSSYLSPLRRLRKKITSPKLPLVNTDSRSSPAVSPVPFKRSTNNAFDVMADAAKAKSNYSKHKFRKSDFIESEAQESDDDEMVGFGLTRKNDEDEEDGEDLDKTLETLVDDRDMDEEMIAAQRVVEKYKEHTEMDDLAIEKLHQAAVQGELRKKRKNHGVGMEDSDEDSDEDEVNRKLRQSMYKRQKIDRDNIKELGEHPETRSFYEVYEQDLNADNDEFGYLQVLQPPDFIANHEEEKEEEGEEHHETVTTEEVQRRVREVARQEKIEETLDPHDVSWIDDEHSEGDENIRVKPVVTARKQHEARHRGLDQTDFEGGFEGPISKPWVGANLNRLETWAKSEGKSRNTGTKGRSSGGAAVTGHKVKSGGGSLRTEPTAHSAFRASNDRRQPIKAQPSVLLEAADERRKMRFS